MTKMTQRIAPPPDKFASFPYDGQILSYFDGVFEAVFVVMQPFCQVEKENQWILDRELDVLKQDFLHYAKPICWQEIMQKLYIDEYKTLETGTQSYENRLYDHWQRMDIKNQLIALEKECNIFAPETNEFAPYFENDIFNVVKKLGYDWIWVGDEFATERKLYFVDDLIKSNEVLATGAKLFTPDYQLLISTAYGVSSLFICSSKQMIATICQSADLEGFYCTPQTEVVWNIKKLQNAF